MSEDFSVCRYATNDDLINVAKVDLTDLRNEVVNLVKETQLIPSDKVEDEVTWFFHRLGILDRFISTMTASKMAEYVLCIYAEKLKSKARVRIARGDKSNGSDAVTGFELKVEYEDSEGAVFLTASEPGVSMSNGPMYERKIDSTYLNDENPDSFRVVTYRSHADVSADINQKLRIYFVQKCNFSQAGKYNNDVAKMDKSLLEDRDFDISTISSEQFLATASVYNKKWYADVLREAVMRKGPVTHYFDKPYKNVEEYRVVIAYRKGEGAQNFFSSLSDLYHYYDCYSIKKYCEQFANNMVVMSIHIQAMANSRFGNVKSIIKSLIKEVSLLFIVPDNIGSGQRANVLHKAFRQKKLCMREAAYSYAGWIFCQHFLNKLGKEYELLIQALQGKDENLLSKIKSRLRSDTFTERYISDVISKYPLLVKCLYRNFHEEFYPVTIDAPSKMGLRSGSIDFTSFKDGVLGEVVSAEAEIEELIKRTCTNENEQKIFECFLTFNKHILKTNFFTTTKVAISFRLDPSYLPKVEYPNNVYGLFFLL